MLVTFLTDSVRLTFTNPQFRSLNKLAQRLLLRLTISKLTGPHAIVLHLSHEDWRLYEAMRAVVINPPVHLVPSDN